MNERPQRLTRDLPAMDDEPVTGDVRWFSDEKGYGFIAPDDGSEDVFVRYSALDGDGFRALTARQRVRFQRTTDDRGPRAANVEVL